MIQALQVLGTVLALAVLPGVFIEDARAGDASGRAACSTDQKVMSERVVTAEFRPETDRHVVPVAGRPEPRPAGSPSLPPGTVNGFQLVRGKVGAMSSQVKSLEASLNQPTWNTAVQTQVSNWRSAVAGLQQDVGKLVAVNRAPNMNVGLQVSNALQARVTELGQALDGLAQARDTTSARGALTRITASLGNIVKTMDVNQQCCEALTCCGVAIR